MSLEGESFANDYHWRSTKAKKQLRDRFGRWIAVGANVRWRADGQEQTGIVTSVVDGKAYVDKKNLDGTISKTILDANSIRVLATKARLPQSLQEFYDEGNNFSKAMENPDFNAAVEKDGKASIKREDGYALLAEIQEPRKDKGNNILYQLYAPAGVSLGQYTGEAKDSFDDMVEENKSEANTSPTGGEAPAPTGGESAPAAPAAPAGGGVTASGEEKPYRVPEAVRTEILANLSADIPAEDYEVASRLANDPTVSLSDIKWIHNFFCSHETAESLRGGYKGKKWASKIVEPLIDEETLADHPKYDFDDETYDYFAIGDEEGSTVVNDIIAVKYDTGEVFSWGEEGFALVPGLDLTEVDEAQITPIDELTALELVKLIDAEASDIDLLNIFPEERNLFAMAEAELDFDEIDRSYSIVAAGAVGADGYTPLERSSNAKKQRRGAGGKFGEEPDQVATVAKQSPVVKAKLPAPLPLVADPAARIDEFISSAPETPIMAAGEPVQEEPAEDGGQAAVDAATGPTDEAMYFAIVDEIDKTAVLDAVAIVKKNGAPEAWIRSQSTWAPSPDSLAALQGSTPPPVVELKQPEPLKTVLTQIDAHDSGADTTPTPDAMDPNAKVIDEETGVVASANLTGFALEDGSLPIFDTEDLKQAITASGATTDIFVKAHIRKRARALNRMDLVPEAWREFSLAEIGELTASQNVYGPYGEILVASGVPGIADTPSDFKNAAKLKAYWTRGKGALKIRWGTKGDLTRAHKHLTKYVGPERAWGLAQNYHKSLFGVPNITHDRATGQYVPRRRKK
jgi:hypothetical protein